MQEDMRKDVLNSSLLKTITSSDVEELCANITDCLKQQYPFEGIGFYLRDAGSTRTFFHSDTVPKEIVQSLQEILLRLDQTKATASNILYFGQKQGELVVFNPQEHPESIEPVGIVFPLSIQEQTVGTLAFVTKPETFEDLTTETPVLPAEQNRRATFVSI